MKFRKLEFTNGDYEISETGIVKSLKFGKEKFIGIYKSNYGYLTCTLSFNGGKKYYNIHQLVAIAFLKHKPNGLNVVVDHIDDNKENNHYKNLRLITHAENITKWREEKKSKYLGVYPHKETGKWISRIKINKKIIHLGLFITEEEAGSMFEKAESNIHFYKGNNELFRNKLNSIT